MESEQGCLKRGVVTFAGAGPGAVDLLTLRCRDAIAEADVISYAGFCLKKEVLAFASSDCRMYDSASRALPQLVDIMAGAVQDNEKVLRLHTGDPSIYGAIAEQAEALRERGISYAVIPGVTSVSAAAADVGAEMTVPGVTQSVIMTRMAGRTPVPEGEDLRDLAKHHASMALFLSVGNMDAAVDELRAGGLPWDTPVAVIYRASWPDQQILRGTLDDIAEKTRAAGITRQAIVLVGHALTGKGEASRLYAPSFSHGYRDADDYACDEKTGDVSGELPDQSSRLGQSTAGQEQHCAPFSGSVAVYGITEQGSEAAVQLRGELGVQAFIPSRFRHLCEDEHGNGTDQGGSTTQDKGSGVEFFESGELPSTIHANWDRFDGHVFIMAAGIVVRQISALLKDKTVDPAVVVCDEKGSYAVSLLSGHIGGANRLAHMVAEHLNGWPVITTATDSQRLTAFDEAAEIYGWTVENPAAIKQLNRLLLEKKPVAIVWPENVVDKIYGGMDHIIRIASPADMPEEAEGLVTLDCSNEFVREALSGDEEGANKQSEVPVLRMRRRGVVLGIGCHRGIEAASIAHAVEKVSTAAGVEEKQIVKLATAELKEDEPGLRKFAAEKGWRIDFYSSGTLSQVQVPSPSGQVNAVTGTSSVAEAAAVYAAGGRLLMPKQKCGDVTVAVATISECREK